MIAGCYHYSWSAYIVYSKRAYYHSSSSYHYHYHYHYLCSDIIIFPKMKAGDASSLGAPELL